MSKNQFKKMLIIFLFLLCFFQTKRIIQKKKNTQHQMKGQFGFFHCNHSLVVMEMLDVLIVDCFGFVSSVTREREIEREGENYDK